MIWNMALAPTKQAKFTPPNEHYAAALSNWPVRDKKIDTLAFRIRQWSNEGIRVFVFRTPISDEMEKIEDEKGLFDEEKLRSSIENSGGRWFSFDNRNYDWRDGHHMTTESAVHFSNDLGKELSSYLN